MAEVFAIVSAGVGVAAATGQLIDGITKLHSFCAQVRNIPDEVRVAIEDLSVMTELLTFLRIEIGQEGLALQSSSSANVLLNLHQSSREVAEVLEDMQKMVEKKSSWGRVKAVNMTKKLERASKRAENAQRMVLILLAAENRMMFRQNFDALERDVTAISTRVSMASSVNNFVGNANKDAQTNTGVSILLNEDAISTDSVDRRTAQGNTRKMGPNVARIKLRLPSWLSNPVWEFNVYKATQGWDVRLRSYNLRPEESKIFKAVEQGDLLEVRKLLSSGRANISDRDPRGRGVLHFAAQGCADYGHTMIEYLIRSGADVHDVDSRGFPPYYSISRWGSDDMDEQTQLRLAAGYKAFMCNQGWVPSHPSLRISFEGGKAGSDATDILPVFKSPPRETISSFLNNMWPPWKDMSPADRIETLFPTFDVDALTGLTNALYMRECLSREFIQGTFADWKTEHRVILVEWIFTALAAALIRGPEKGLEESRLFLQDMHLSGSLITTLREMDPLSWFVQQYVSQYVWSEDVHRVPLHITRVTKAIQEGLKHYLSEMILLDIKVDLLIEIENLWITHKEWIRQINIWYLGKPIDIIKVDYGPSIEDWYLWLSNPIDEFVGEFWDMIEHPERAIPGGWVE